MNRFGFLGLLLLASSASAADTKEELASGCKDGQSIRVFNVSAITGPEKGKTLCYVWKNGSRDSFLIFAREVTPDLTSLVKELDKTLKKNTKARGVFVLLDKETKANRQKLTELAAKEKLSLPLTINKKGEKDPYKLNPDADVIVIYYKNKKAVASHAFKKNKITPKDVQLVVRTAEKTFG